MLERWNDIGNKLIAMAMSLFPMSFHRSSISSDRERAGLGG
jgi:hypothetical protein